MIYNVHDNSALDLLENTKVQAIIGPDPTVKARILDVLQDKANVPILSFSTNLFIGQNPYHVQIAQDEITQFKGIAAMIKSFESKNIILICEDTGDGRTWQIILLLPFMIKTYVLRILAIFLCVIVMKKSAKNFISFNICRQLRL